MRRKTARDEILLTLKKLEVLETLDTLVIY